MGHGYMVTLNHHQERHKAASFLPMLCSRPSFLRDVSLPRLKCLESSTGVSDEDPLSPRISCIGQVKRSNKITSFPTLRAGPVNSIITTTQNDGNTAYSKLRRLFSYQGLPTTIRLATPRRKTTRRSSSEKWIRANNSRGTATLAPGKRITCSSDGGNCKEIINIEDLDPPLPVVKRLGKNNSNGDHSDDHQSLWTRRSGGAALRSLQIQINQIQLETNTV